MSHHEPHQKHLIQVFRNNDHIGSGVRLTRYFALTAAHCLGDDRENRMRPVLLRLPDGRHLDGEVQQFDLLADMALLKIVFQKGESVPLPGIHFDVAREGESWTAVHPRPDDGMLRGTVSDVSVIYQSTGEQAVNCHRLRHDGAHDDVRKFAGSPVGRGEPDPDLPSVVLGLLVARPATTDAPQDTLFAGTIDEAVRRFDTFKFRPAPQQTLSGSERIYEVRQDHEAEALARKDRTVPAGLAAVTSYVNLRWHRPRP
ncbi:S1 family peptidase [Streptomyces durmitorensis]